MDVAYLVECLVEFYDQVLLHSPHCRAFTPLRRRFADDQRCLTPAVVQRTSNEDKQAIEEELLAFRQEDGSWKQCEAIITAASDSRLQCTPANPPPPSPPSP